ncbi:hypothetical protein [Bacillus sp. FJAT-49736]|uniref:hypothetical protein n=1 Tax=Bacillus sp. FJAT-49736 TaxID=2833582 RepID=UPI001BC98D6B|nr:hypothetical protein [Bacillus sp. FJAT-49736]MBS4174281.1 hypothetical protein [Bacillus sp. FJAT-49736]
MKKILLIIVALFLVTSPISAATNNGLATAKNKYKDYLLSYVKEKNNEPNEWYFLVDLDRDGIPELFGGSEAQIFSPINMAITFKNNKVSNIKFTGDNGVSGLERDTKGNMNIGLPTIEGLKLYSDKKTKKYTFIGSDYTGRYNAWTEAIYEIIFSKGNL